MSKLRKIKTFLLFGLIAIVSVAGFCFAQNVDKKSGGLTNAVTDEINAGTVRPADPNDYVGVGLFTDSDGYFLIKSQYDLTLINNNMGGNYRLTKDITITGQWNPLGMDMTTMGVTPFTGKFDGAGYTITMNSASTYDVMWKNETGIYIPGETDVLGQRVESEDFRIRGVRGYGLFSQIQMRADGSASVVGLRIVDTSTIYLINSNNPGNYSQQDDPKIGFAAYGCIAGIVYGNGVYDNTAIDQCIVVSKVNINCMLLCNVGVLFGGVAGVTDKSNIRNCLVEHYDEDSEWLLHLNTLMRSSDGSLYWECNDGLAQTIFMGSYHYVGGFAGYSIGSVFEICILNAAVINPSFSVPLCYAEIPVQDITYLWNRDDPMGDMGVIFGNELNDEGSRTRDSFAYYRGDRLSGYFEYGEKQKVLGVVANWTVTGTRRELASSCIVGWGSTLALKGATSNSFELAYVAKTLEKWDDDARYTWISAEIGRYESPKLGFLPRAFVKWVRVEFYCNEIKDVHGEHGPDSSSTKTFDVIPGFATWQQIQDSIGGFGTVEYGYKKTSVGLETIDDACISPKDKSATFSETSMDGRAYPWRHSGGVYYGRIIWTPIDVTLQFNTKADEELDSAKFTGSGVYELTLDNLKTATEAINKQLNDNGTYNKCVAYFRYYTGCGALDHGAGSVGRYYLHIRYSSSGIQYKYADTAGYDYDSSVNSGSWTTLSKSGGVIDFYKDKDDTDAIQMRAVLKDASLNLRIYGYGSVYPNINMSFSGEVEKVTSNDMIKWYQEYKGVRGESLLTPGSGYRIIGWSTVVKDYEGTYMSSSSTGVKTSVTYLPYERFVYTLGKNNKGYYITEIDALQSFGTIDLYPIFERDPLTVYWIDPIEGDNDNTITDVYGVAHCGRSILATGTISTEVYANKNFPTITYNSKTYTNFLINFSTGLGTSSYQEGVYQDSDYLRWYPVSNWKTKIYTTSDKVPDFSANNYVIYIMPIDIEGSKFVTPTITINYYVPELQRVGLLYTISQYKAETQVYYQESATETMITYYDRVWNKRFSWNRKGSMQAYLVAASDAYWESGLYELRTEKDWYGWYRNTDDDSPLGYMAYLSSLGLNAERDYHKYIGEYIYVEPNGEYNVYLPPKSLKQYSIRFQRGDYYGFNWSEYNVLDLINNATGTTGIFKTEWNDDLPYFKINSVGGDELVGHYETSQTVQGDDKYAYTPVGTNLNDVYEQWVYENCSYFTDKDTANKNLSLIIYIVDKNGDDDVKTNARFRWSIGSEYRTQQVISNSLCSRLKLVYDNLPAVADASAALQQYGCTYYKITKYRTNNATKLTGPFLSWATVSGTDLKDCIATYGRTIIIYVELEYLSSSIELYQYKDKDGVLHSMSGGTADSFKLQCGYNGNEEDIPTNWKLTDIPKVTTTFTWTAVTSKLATPVDDAMLIGVKDEGGYFKKDTYNLVDFDTDGNLVGFASNFKVTTIQLYGVWGYSLLLQNTNGDNIPADAPYWKNSIANRVSMDNGIYCDVDGNAVSVQLRGESELPGFIYYDFTKPIMITSGSWRTEGDVTVDNVPTGYYYLANNTSLRGTSSGLKRDTHNYFVGHIGLTLVSNIQYILNSWKYNGSSGSQSFTAPYNVGIEVEGQINPSKVTNNAGATATGWILSSTIPTMAPSVRVKYNNSTYRKIEDLEKAGYSGDLTIKDTSGNELYEITYSNGFVKYVTNLGGNSIHLQPTAEKHGDDVQKYTITYCTNYAGTEFNVKHNNGSEYSGSALVISYAKTDTITIYGENIASDLTGNIFRCWELVGGYDYDSWTEYGDGVPGKIYNAGDVVTGMSGDVILKAIFMNYITLDTDGGDISASYYPSDYATFDDGKISYLSTDGAFNLPTSSQMSKTGYTFVGWIAEGADLEGYSYGAAIVNHIGFGCKKSSAYVGNYYLTNVTGGYGDATLKAVWIESQYNMAFLMKLNTGKYTLDIDRYAPNTNKIYGYPAYVNVSIDEDGNNIYTFIYKPSSEFALPTYVHDNGSTLHISSWTISSSNMGESEINMMSLNGESVTVKGWTQGGFINVDLDAAGEPINNVVHRWGDVTLTIDTDNIEYIIELDLGEGTLSSYSTGVDRAYYKYDDGRHYIYYKPGSPTFDLPNKDQVTRSGYTLRYWLFGQYESASMGSWESLNGKTDSVNFACVNEKMYGCVKLTAVWFDDRANAKYTMTLDLSEVDNTAGLSARYEEYIKRVISNIKVLSYTVGDNFKYNIVYKYNSEFELPTQIIVNGAEVELLGWKVSSSGDVTKEATLLVGDKEYQVKGWQFNEKLLVEDNAHIVQGRIGAVTLVPICKFDEYQIYINPNGENVTIENNGFRIDTDSLPYYNEATSTIHYTVQSVIDFHYFTFERTGYTFDGLKVEEMSGLDCGNWKAYIGLIISNDDDGDLDSDYPFAGMEGYVQVTAQWKANEYDITLDWNGGSENGWGTLNEGILNVSTAPYHYKNNDNDSDIIRYTIESSFDLPTPTRSGYTFTGWQVTNAGGSWEDGKLYDKDNLNISNMYGNVKLQAQWKETPYTITFDDLDENWGLDGGSFEIKQDENTSNYYIDYTIDSSGELPKVTGRDGYEFIGWAIEGVTIDSLTGNYEYEDSKLFNYGATYNDATKKYYISYLNSGSYGDWTLTPVWNALEYKMILQYEDDVEFKETEYSVYLEENGIGCTTTNNYQIEIYYTIETKFNLPNSNYIYKGGYSFYGWKVTSAGGSWIVDDTQAFYSVSSGNYGNVTLKADFMVGNNYTITLSLNGGEINGYEPDGVAVDNSKNTITYNATSKFKLPGVDEVARNGYKLTGWKVSQTTGGQGIGNWTNGMDLDPAYYVEGRYGDVTLTAQWETIKYTIHLDLNGGTSINNYTLDEKPNYPYYDSVNMIIHYTIESEFSLPNDVTRDDGYTFKGWKVTTGNVGSWIEDKEYEYDGENLGKLKISNMYGEFNGLIETVVILTAIWDATVYTITLDLDENPAEYRNPSITIENECVIDTEGKPVGQEGKEIKYTIEQKINLSQVTLTCNGYTFDGWELAVTAGNWNDTKVTSCAGGSAASGMYGNITLKAKWKIVTYIISYARYTDEPEGHDASKVKQYGDYKITDQITIWDGVCAGFSEVVSSWSVENALKYNYDSGLFDSGYAGNWTAGNYGTTYTGMYGDVLLYSVKGLAQYSITLTTDDGEIKDYSANPAGTFNASGGNYSITYQLDSGDIELPTSLNTTRNGYTFAGWELDTNGYEVEEVNATTRKYTKEGVSVTCEVSGDKVTKVLSGSTGNITLKANWIANEYTITFNLNGNSVQLVNYSEAGYTYNTENKTHTCTYDITMNFNLPSGTQISQYGYTFKGWEVTVADGKWEKGKLYDKDKLAISGMYGDVTLQAQWNKDEYKIIIDANNGTLNYDPTTDGVDVTYDNETITYSITSTFKLPTTQQITRNGYTFTGWKVQEHGDKNNNGNWTIGETLSAGSSIEGKRGNVKLVATWNIVGYQITLDANGGSIAGFDNEKYTTETAADGTVTYYINYNVETGFDLPWDDKVKKTGSKLDYWKITEKKDNASASWSEKVPYCQDNSNLSFDANHGLYGNITLTAQWDYAEYTITFDLNKGDTTNSTPELSYKSAKVKENTATTLTYTLGYTLEDTISLPCGTNQISSDGYSFTGWTLSNVNDDGNNWPGNEQNKDFDFDNERLDNFYKNGKLELSKLYGDVTLVAQWEAIEYTITFALLTQNEEVNNYNVSRNILDPDTYSITYTIAQDITELPSEFMGYYNVEQWSLYGYYTCSLAGAGDGFEYTLDEDKTGGNWASSVSIPDSENPITKVYGNVILVAMGELIDYTITFDMNVDASEITNSTPFMSGYITEDGGKTYTYTYHYSSVFIGLEKATRYGYNFTGWTLAKNEGNWTQDEVDNLVGGSTIIKKYGDITLIANWEIETYTINYAMLEEGESADTTTIQSKILKEQQITYTVNDEISLLTEVDGYETITDWIVYGYYKYDATDKELKESERYESWSSTVYTADKLSGMYGNVVLYRIGNMASYELTLDMGAEDATVDDSEGQVEVIKNKIPYVKDADDMLLPTLSRVGYTFLGWKLYDEGSYVKKIVGDTITYTITGEGSATAELKFSTKDEDATGVVTRGAVETLGTYIRRLLKGSFGNATLQADWQVIEYDITLNIADKDRTDTIPVDIAKIDELYLNDSEMPKYSDGVVTYTIENSVELPDVKPVNGYVFLGWVVEGAEGGYVSDNQFDTTHTFTFKKVDEKYFITGLQQGSYENISLKAIYKLETYTINFELEVKVGMAKIIWKDEYYNREKEIMLPGANDVEADAYTLIGWKVKDSLGNWDAEKDVFEFKNCTLDENNRLNIGSGRFGSKSGENETSVTLVAMWEAKEFTITFDKGDGDSLNANLKQIDYTADDEFNFPALNADGEIDEWQYFGATRAGYPFAGWKVKETAGSWEHDAVIWKIDDSTKELKEQYGNVTLVPIWGDALPYTLTIVLKGEDMKITPTLNGNEVSEYSFPYYITTSITLPNEIQVGAKGYDIGGFRVTATDVTEGTYAWKIDDEYDCSAVIKNKIGNATLTAVWTPKEYTLTLNSNEGKFTDEFIDGVKDGSIKYGEATSYDENTKNVTIKYTIASEFDLPGASDVVKDGVRLIGWSTGTGGYITGSDTRFKYRDMKGMYYITGLNSDCLGDFTLNAQWMDNIYQINLDFNGGLISSYSLYDEEDPQLNYSATDAGGRINYTAKSVFDLPSLHLTKKGYTLRGWMVVGDTNGAVEYDEIIDKYNTNTYTSTILFNLSLKADGNYYITGVNSGSSGDVDLIAIWQENKYTLKYNKGQALGEETKVIGYNELYMLDNEPSCNDYVFVGWSSVDYQSNLYSTISANTNNTYNEENPLDLSARGEVGYITWGNKILPNGSYVIRLTEGSDCCVEPLTIFNVYAVWLPKYEVNVNANDAVIYKDGVSQEGTVFTETNTYLEGYTLFGTERAEIFNAPTGTSGYRLFRKGYTISGWIVKIGTTQYCVSDLNTLTTPNIGDWGIGTNIVKTGINLQYLQGNIVATPQWTEMEFDVIFRTSGDEAYKEDYTKEIRTEGVKFGSAYIIHPNPSLIVASDVSKIKSTSIKGYSISYIKPYSDGEIEDYRIATSGIWNYTDLEYVQNGSKWEVKVEGYYTPVLYRVKINLNVPFDTAVNITGNDFVVKTNIEVGQLATTYESLSLSAGAKYISNTNYSGRQKQLFKTTDGEYYIYLLQDQEIYSVANTNDDALKLPIFEVDSYEMQYYSLEGTGENYCYVVTENLRVEKPKNQPEDWKYSYCDENGVSGGTKFEFKIVWYRNLINFEIQNILEQQNSSTGYVVVTETEMVTGNLFEHKNTHIIIYAKDEDSVKYKYLHFEFDEEYVQDVITERNYEGFAYAVGNLLKYSAEELLSKGITKSENNTISIYFGNKITIKAYDQSLDNSLDDFIGYRFDNYSHTMKSSNTGTCEKIDELDNVSSRNVEIDLGKYTGLEDRDTICVNVEFARIIYTLKMFVGSADDDETKEFGAIDVKYRDYKAEATEHNIQYFVDITGIYSLTAKMNVYLGYELNRWMFISNEGVKTELGTAITYEAKADWLQTVLRPLGYSVEPEQPLGQIKAECKYIEFGIKVYMINEANGNEELESYEVDGLQGVSISDGATSTSKVIMGKEYSLNINPEDKNGNKYYKFDEKYYAYRELYLGHSSKHNENQLITFFAYPLKEISTIDLNVTYDLLDKTIEYTLNQAVEENNRYLQLYIIVSPIATITFDVENDDNDPFKDSRQITVDGITVLEGVDGSQLAGVSSFEGYIKQKVSIKFIADVNYYKEAYLTYSVDGKLTLTTNGVGEFTITGDTKITVKLVPKTYTLTAKIEFGEYEYVFDDDDENEYSWKNAANGSGVALLENAEIQTAIVRTAYYYGDTITVIYALNSAVKDDYSVFIKVNEKDLTDTEGECTITFSGSDLDILLQIKPKSSKVNITTNYPTTDIGEVYVEVNWSSVYYIQRQGVQEQNELELNAGDTVRVFIKTNVDYVFDQRYVFSSGNGANASKTTSGYTNRYTGYYIFTLFDKDNPYSRDLVGYYILQFAEITTDIRLVYSQSGAGSNYTYVLTNDKGESVTSVTEGVNVSLVKGEDALGYRFEEYSYIEPSYNMGAVILEDKFVVDADMIEYISTIKVNNYKRTWYIYVNFVQQYTIVFRINNSDLIQASVEDIDGNKLDAGIQYKNNQGGWSVARSAGYYDSGDVVVFNIATKDTDHYSISATFSDGGVYNPINDYWINEQLTLKDKHGIAINNSEYQRWYTIKYNMSGFRLPRELKGNLVVEISADTEQFDTILKEYYEDVEGELENYGEILLLNGSFDTNSTIHYEVNYNSYYGSRVSITIYIEKPLDDATGYYQISSIRLGGNEITLDEKQTSTYGGKECYVYTLEYEISQDLLTDNEEGTKIVSLEITYKGIKKVQIKITE